MLLAVVHHHSFPSPFCCPTPSANASAYQFCFNGAGNTCYIADDATTANGGGLQKWTFNGTSWSVAYTYTFTSNPRGVIADFNGANPLIYLTTSETTGNKLYSILDGGSVGSSTVTLLATAGTNKIFRGVAFSPEIVVTCNTPTITAAGGTTICAGQTLSLTSTAIGSSPLSYTWAGAGSFSSNNVNNPTVTGASSGNYTISVSNSCGTASAVVVATVNPLPSVTSNSATICAGSTVTLIANGATVALYNT
jgi:hypothetical protein